MASFLAEQESTAPGREPCKKSEMFDYPSGFLPRQKATSPDKGRHGCGANPEDIGRCGGRGEVASGRSMIAPTKKRPYRHPERDVEGAVPYEGGANPEKKE